MAARERKPPFSTAQPTHDKHASEPATLPRLPLAILPTRYYYRPASSPTAATKWKFHFQGGGWCNDVQSCLSRSKGLLGSSTTYPQNLSDFWGGSAGFYGLMSANTSDVNPFGEWNFVWLAYCDGTSQTSDRDQAVDAGNGKKIHFRGNVLFLMM